MNLFKAELLKMKNTAVLQMAVVSPVLAIVIGINAYSIMKGRMGNITSWSALASITSVMFVGMLLPMLIIYLTMMMGRIEHLNNGWKQLLAMPVKRLQIYLTKYLVIQFILVLTIISYLLQYSAAAYILGAKGSIPISAITDMIYVFVTLQPFTALLFLLANRFTSVVVPLGTGMAAIISGFFIVQSSYWKFAPWTYPMALLQMESSKTVVYISIGVLLFLLIFVFDAIDFNNKDII